jgi:hypothetical protein
MACRLQELRKVYEKLQAQYPNTGFGSKPAKINVYCLGCDFANECAELTAKRAAGAK